MPQADHATAGTPVPAGALITPGGQPGPPGQSFIIKGTVPGPVTNPPAQLPQTGNAVGDVYVDQATGHAWLWNGTTWIDLGPSLQGTQGPQGPPGPTGPPGLSGPTSVSSDSGNIATLGTDRLIFVPATKLATTLAIGALQILSGKAADVLNGNNVFGPVPLATPYNPGAIPPVTSRTTDFLDGTNSFQDLLSAVFPAGIVMPYAGTVNNPPLGWLGCDGSAVNRTAYPRLFAAIGVTYGAGDGSTTFNLPDLRGRMAIGAGQGTGLTNRPVATNGGEETHQLTVPELASHTHVQNTHSHVVQGVNDAGATFTAGSVTTLFAPPTGNPYSPGTDSVAAVNQNTGSSSPHNNMSPFLVLNYVIKV